MPTESQDTRTVDQPAMEARLRRLAMTSRCPNCTIPLCDWDGFAWVPELQLAHAMGHIAETNAALAADIAEIRRLLTGGRNE